MSRGPLGRAIERASEHTTDSHCHTGCSAGHQCLLEGIRRREPCLHRTRERRRRRLYLNQKHGVRLSYRATRLPMPPGFSSLSAVRQRDVWCEANLGSLPSICARRKPLPSIFRSIEIELCLSIKIKMELPSFKENRAQNLHRVHNQPGQRQSHTQSIQSYYYRDQHKG